MTALLLLLALTATAWVVVSTGPRSSGQAGSLATAGSAVEEPVAGAPVPLAVHAPAHRTVRTPAARVRDRIALPRHSGAGRRIVYSLSRQRVWLVGSAGHVQRTYLVSGRRTQPGPGRYRVYSKSLSAHSSVSPETMRYMVRFAYGRRTGVPVGFHTIPRNRAGHAAQKISDLGRAISAGCVRQRRADALVLWHFSHVGTRVAVTR